MTEANSTQIAFTAPHYAATNVGLDILEKGGTAIEAMVAAAASIAVNYPHMNGLGGDGFWLISEPGKAPIAINAAGTAAGLASLNFYKNENSIPSRGPRAALTMAGAVSGWQKALEISSKWQAPIDLPILLNTAISQAQWGLETTQSLSDASVKTFDEMRHNKGFEQFLIKDKALKKGKIVKLPKLANTLKTLARNGLDDFYRGETAELLAKDLSEAGSPIRLKDFHEYRATMVEPISVQTDVGKLYNLPGPTQGIASLIILALYDRLQSICNTEAEHTHLLIECTKQAFLKRDKYVTDPVRRRIDLSTLLSEASLATMSGSINMKKALPWPHIANDGDTVWLGACDNRGRMVSYIQSLYWEFGSGIVSPSTGVVWNNRGTSFSLTPGHSQQIEPGLQPFHTLNPAFAELNDGRRISYGTMGGEGQPQTQAALFSRYIYQGMSLHDAIFEGRWLLGRTWGDQSTNLKIESDFAELVAYNLDKLGHEIEKVPTHSEMMGHAGAIVLDKEGVAQAATDPRSDGKSAVHFVKQQY